MSEQIPIGSPPAPPGRHAAPGGWYPDPAQPGQERYWDGWQWSRNTRDAAGPAGSGQSAGAYPPAGQYPGRQPDQPYAGPSGQPYQQQPYQQQPYQQQPYYAGAPGLLSPMTADQVPLAGWWWRVLSVVIDSVLLGIVSGLISIPIYRPLIAVVRDYYEQALRAAQSGTTPAPFDPGTVISTNAQLVVITINLVVGLAYFVVLWRFRGATLGQLATGLRVVPVDQGRFQGRLPWSQVIIRSLLWVLPSAYIALRLIQLLDVLFPLWQPKRQTLHDLAARTQVITTRGR